MPLRVVEDAAMLTHAGGIVLRGDGPSRELLIVRGRRNPEHWVLPKGHIEAGETPEQAAVREVQEEGGVVAEIVDRAGELELEAASASRDAVERVRVVYYTMRYVSETPPAEARERRWCSPAEARELLTFVDARDLLDRFERQRGGA